MFHGLKSCHRIAETALLEEAKLLFGERQHKHKKHNEATKGGK